MRLSCWFLLPCLLPMLACGQELNIKKNYGGVLSLGARSTISTFNDGVWGNTGMGTGGQILLQLSDRVNTAWFADYTAGGVGNFANRTDYHIGWSVMYYLVSSSTQKKIQPYVLAGHCFDYSQFKDNLDDSHYAERWSSAVQTGAGTHFNLTQRFDVIVQGQYMIHLGNDIDVKKENGGVVFHNNSSVNLEGHILITVGVNYKIADLW